MASSDWLKQPTRDLDRKRGGNGTVIAVLAAVAILAGGGWYLFGPTGIAAPEPASESAATTPSANGPATTPAAPDRPREPPAAAAAAPSPRRVPAAGPATVNSSAGVEAAAEGAPASPVERAPEAPRATTAPAPAVPAVVADVIVYSAGDPEVTPPKPLRPELLATLTARPGIRLDALSMAVVVNAEGVVESARGLTDPQNLAEFILLTDALTVVKTWRFTPATKEGLRVKYRQMMPIRDLVRPNP